MNRLAMQPPQPAPGWLCLLTSSDRIVPASELAARMAAQAASARLCLEAGKDARWDELLLTHADWRGIARVERLAVSDGTPGARALAVLAASLAGARSAAAADRARACVARVRTIYTFRALPGADDAGGWDAIAAVRDALSPRRDGLLPSGGQVACQARGPATGSNWRARLGDGTWVHVEITPDDAARQEHDPRGDVPPRARETG